MATDARGHVKMCGRVRGGKIGGKDLGGDNKWVYIERSVWWGYIEKGVQWEFIERSVTWAAIGPSSLTNSDTKEVMWAE